ncbi:site-specific integrase (plasmid) [Salinirubellus salinus]|uniref:Site-specific integrase n=1 Tax=Salinirubellus salinus TaxID=1364945 RepID=A0A9E7UD50_9EURY|nr:site-specific integrase [Salinirubellus salinus]UWM56993.1 site-specific integrase [Salinirubellus salinus]UWM57032.1 site-specific integrase [Salinirubellus salinus]
MVRVDDSGEVTKCWLEPEELSLLEEAAARADWQREIAMMLMGRCGLRADEVNYPGDAELRRSGKGDCWFVEVRGKNTQGGDPKLRDVWMSDDVQAVIRRFSRERDRETGEAWVQASNSSVRRWVKESAKEVAQDASQPDRWRHVSSHDLRRSWATYHLVERQVDVRTMMSIGGWSDYSAIEPYLAEPTERHIGATMRG